MTFAKNSIIVALLLGLCANVNAAETILTGKIVIDGKKSYSGKTIVKRGTVFHVADNAILEFSGELTVDGTADKPVKLSGAGSAILRFNRCTDATVRHISVVGIGSVESEESHVKISKSTLARNKIGLKITKSSEATLDNVTLTENEIGLVCELKAVCRVSALKVSGSSTGIVVSQAGIMDISRSTITKNKTALFVAKDGKVRTVASKITDNEAGVIFNQNEGSILSTTVFSGNKLAVHGEVYSNVQILDSTFTGNDTAVRFIQFVGGKILGNTFAKNENAVHLEKKSSPEMRYNTFNDNKTALFCDFSAYPLVTLNNFLNNTVHIRLGLSQSADFENRTGSFGLQMNEVVSRQSRRTMEFKNKSIFVGELFAKKNYWDVKTAAQMEKFANISSIHDGHDIPDTTYEGFGDSRYAIDKVVFTPALTEKVVRVKK